MQQIVAARCCNKLLCVYNEATSNMYVFIAVIGCSDKLPGVNASTLDGLLTKFCCRNRISSLQHVAAIKFCRSNKIFNKILL